jgi:tetratricopeptide (TPR) repeat protein
MLATFAGTEGKVEARSTAWVCALRPGTLEDYSVAITLARQALDRQLNSRTKCDTLTGYRETLGAVLFRAGQYEEALRHVQAESEKYADSKHLPARIAFLLAITHQRLGHAADARMWLDRANKEADEELNNTAKPPDWSLRLELSLFQREARELIGIQTKAGQQPQVDGVRKRKR